PVTTAVRRPGRIALSKPYVEPDPSSAGRHVRPSSVLATGPAAVRTRRAPRADTRRSSGSSGPVVIRHVRPESLVRQSTLSPSSPTQAKRPARNVVGTSGPLVHKLVLGSRAYGSDRVRHVCPPSRVERRIVTHSRAWRTRPLIASPWRASPKLTRSSW